MNKSGQYRVVAGIKRGRQFTSSKGSRFVGEVKDTIPTIRTFMDVYAPVTKQELADWNKRIEEKRLAKKMAKGKI